MTDREILLALTQALGEQEALEARIQFLRLQAVRGLEKNPDHPSPTPQAQGSSPTLESPQAKTKEESLGTLSGSFGGSKGGSNGATNPPNPPKEEEGDGIPAWVGARAAGLGPHARSILAWVLRTYPRPGMSIPVAEIKRGWCPRHHPLWSPRSSKGREAAEKTVGNTMVSLRSRGLLRSVEFGHYEIVFPPQS
jgi:hypothetical protein